jgi:transketolase
MGDQVGIAVGGTLYYVPLSEFSRIRGLALPETTKTALFSTACRINTLYMIARAGSGHIGSSFSSIDIMSWLQLHELGPADLFFSSKGHDAPAYYSTLIAMGHLSFERLHTLRQYGGLPGHPDISIPNMITNTGSLGMGISKAKGMIYANRRLGKNGNVFVLTGDGELQEGQIWESLVSAANHGLSELTVIVDHNKLQSDTLVSKVSHLGDLEQKFAAFGWHTARCDGNDLLALSQTFAQLKAETNKPKVIIADTIKGKGVSFMEHTAVDSDVDFYKFHSGAPTADAYVRAAQELINTANAAFESVGAARIELEAVVQPAAVAAKNGERLVAAYSEALLQQARSNSNIVALDADLILDTGLIPFQNEFPDRFIECGIAEQDMVSQAGGMALRGLLPVVHSFACFLSARPNEQIYNNATEHTKIVYVGSLAGVVPAGPGHSHQAVRDISGLSAIPGLTLVEPSCAAEVAPLLDWCLNHAQGSSYLRLVSIPCDLPYQLPETYKVHVGRGVSLSEGESATLIAYGPVLLSEAMKAAQMLSEQHGLKVRVINLPWLNYIDFAWLANALGACAHIFSLDNHYHIGGQGDRLADGFASGAIHGKILHRIALTDIPACGGATDVLAHHRLNAEAIAHKVLSALAATTLHQESAIA